MSIFAFLLVAKLSELSGTVGGLCANPWCTDHVPRYKRRSEMAPVAVNQLLPAQLDDSVLPLCCLSHSLPTLSVTALVSPGLLDVTGVTLAPPLLRRSCNLGLRQVFLSHLALQAYYFPSH